MAPWISGRRNCTRVLTLDQQLTIRHIFQQLTQLGEGTEDTRRRVFLDNLISEPLHPTERVKTVVERLADKENRLLVTSEVVSKDDQAERRAIVDVAHEALIRYWRPLRQWIEQNRDLLRQQRRIETSAVIWQEHQKSKGYLLQGLLLDEALHFQKQQAETFPLSDEARAFIQKSRRQRQWNRLKIANSLIIPATIAIVIIEYNIREERIKADYERLEEKGTYAEKLAVRDLVKGCREQQIHSWLPAYLLERLFGNCRSLAEVKLAQSNLRNLDLRNADLSNADLRSAELTGANLGNTNLSNADLQSASLGNATLKGVNLENANLSDTYLVKANLTDGDASNAEFQYADLSETNLNSTIFSGASLNHAVLFDAVLLEANFQDANLDSANFRGATLERANFSNANLDSTNFRSASIGDTDFYNANLSNAYFNETNISDVNFANANLMKTIILAVDFRDTNGLNHSQIEDGSPIICNAILPEELSLRDIANRDCEKLAEILHERYPAAFKTSEEAKIYIDEKRSIIWK
jgi:uncharacterized protein YjbI with pentapeptide repeats